jgi:hypothetical protein
MLIHHEGHQEHEGNTTALLPASPFEIPESSVVKIPFPLSLRAIPEIRGFTSLFLNTANRDRDWQNLSRMGCPSMDWKNQ